MIAATKKQTNPLRTNTKPKHGIINWEALPAGKCQFDYRPAEGFETDTRVMGKLAMIGVISLILQAGLQWLELGKYTKTISFVDMLYVGGIFALLQFVASFSRSSNLKPTTAASLAFWFTAILWFGLNSFYFLNYSQAALIGLILIGFPLLGYWIDQTTTFAMFWHTAHPTVSMEQMSRGRMAWYWRWSMILRRRCTPTDQLSQQVAAAYLDGWFRLAICWLVPLGIGLYLPFLTGMIVLGLLCLFLMLTAAYQLIRFPSMVSLILRDLNLTWTYGVNKRLVPWKFTSPTGPWWKRQLLTAIVLALLSFFTTQLCWGSVIDTELFFPADISLDEVHQAAINSLGFSAILALLPLVMMVSSFIILTGPLLVHYYDLFETSSSSSEGACFDRLQDSRNPNERGSLMMGIHPPTEIPVLLDSDLLFEHMHILGATGIGKTTLGLIPLYTQLIRKNDGPVMILDCKGDSVLFQTAKLEAEKAGRTFKWFTNRPNHSTYLFNPFQQKHLEKLSLQEILGLLIQSLNLHHGDDYGRAWFTIASRMLLKAAFLQTVPPEGTNQQAAAAPIESFQDLNEIIQLLAQEDDKQFQAAQHLQFLVESLAQFEQLNQSPSNSSSQEVLDQAIHMPDVIKNNEVIYFSLVGALDLSSVSEIARLALFSALAACIAHREETGQRPRFYCVIDEAQTVIAQNIQMVLAQAREHGMACILSHQTMSQLNPPGGVDLRELVMSCTSIKQYFSARDPFLRTYISECSGQVPYCSVGWDQLKSRTLNDEYGLQFAAGNQTDGFRIRVAESDGPRLTSEDIADINRHPNQSVLIVERNSGLSCFHGAFPLETDWPFSKAEHDRRNFDLAWPPQSEATITTTTCLPAMPVGSDDSGSDSKESDEQQQKQAQERLTQLREQLQKNKNKKEQE